MQNFTYFYLARAYDLTGEKDLATRSYAKAVTGLVEFTKNNPDYSDGFYLLGNAYFADNQRDKAVEAYKRCLVISPRFIKARYNLGILQILNRNKDEAIEQYRVLLSLDNRLAEALGNEIVDKLKIPVSSLTPVEPKTVFVTRSAGKLIPSEIWKLIRSSTVLITMENDGTDNGMLGSGFFISKDVVATNYHVIKGATSGYVKLFGRPEAFQVIGIVGIDPENDLALLKIKGVNGSPLSLSANISVAVGDDIYAMGNPEGLEGTFTPGIVSALRKVGDQEYMQITAPISHGSSGGAIVNDHGDVVGVAVGSIPTGQSLNFAIPVRFLRSLIARQTPVSPLTSTFRKN